MSNPAATLPTPQARGRTRRGRLEDGVDTGHALTRQDVALAVGQSAAVATAITADFMHATVRPGAYLFALGFGFVMLARHRAPRTILAATIMGIFAYYAIGYPPIGMALPALAALYSAAEADRTRAAVVGGAVLAVVSAYFRIQKESLSTTYLLSYELLTNVSLVAAGISLGVNARVRRVIRDHQRHLRELTALEVGQAAGRRMQAERLRIARDLHDAIGHSISVITLHGNVAREAIGRDNVAASEAVLQIQKTASATMRDLRTTVHLLRSPLGESAQTVPVGLAGLGHLATTARDAGIEVSLRLEVDPGSVPTAIDVTAFRIVQEAVTNMIQHSGAQHGAINARRTGDTVQIEVTDDGRGADQEWTSRSPGGAGTRRGQGLLGMRERAALLGGAVVTGPLNGGGFFVRAVLPARLDP